MSIVKNVWLRGMKKRLGGAVTYMMAGQQITRELAANVKNPRTQKQMMQRVKLAALVNFYRSMRSWAKVGAFSNKKQTWSDYNAFVSANISNNSAFLTKQQAQAGCSVVAPYVVSRGVLPRVQTSYISGRNSFASNIYIGDNDTTDELTLGELSEAIIANNNGINNGDQVSIISVIQRTSEAGPYVIQRAYEFTLDTGSSTAMTEVVTSGVLMVYEEENSNFVLSHPAEEANMGCAFIISRKQGGKILTGDAQLALTPTATDFLATYRSARQRALAIASYGQGDSNFLDPTNSGDSSTPAELNLQILSVHMGGKDYSQGDVIGTEPEAIGEINIGTSVVVDPSTVDEVNFRNQSNNVILSVTDGFTSQSGKLVVNLDEQQDGDLLAEWSNITTIEINAGDASASFSFANNGGQADPGDVTP